MTPRAIAILALVGATAAPCAAAARPWTVADAGAVKAVVSVEVSSHGDALFAVAARDSARNEFATDYLIASAAGAVRRIPFDAPVYAAHWAPDGRTIGVLTPMRSEVPGIAVIDAQSGRTLHTLASGRAIVDFSWAPDGRTIAVTATGPEGDDEGTPVSAWLRPDSDVLGTPAHPRSLWLIDVATRKQRRLANDAWSYGGPATDHAPSWSRDGKRLLVVRQPSGTYGDFERAQVAIVDVASGKATAYGAQPAFMLPDSIAPQFGPGGDVLAVHTWDGTFAAREDVYAGAEDRSASLDRDFWSCGGSQAHWDGNAVLATALDGVDLRLFRLAPGASAVAVTPAGGSVDAFATGGGRTVVAWSTPQKPSELYRLEGSGALTQITHINRLPAGLAVAPTTLVAWAGPAAHALTGQLTMLPHAAALLTEPHGGPQCADDSSFAPDVQYFASNGYAYFRPSVRGSDGYGDWSYKAIVGDFGAGPLTDLLAGIGAAAAAAATPADASYIYGASYGGYLTSYAVTHGGRFRAAVAAFPVTDLTLDYELSESPNITRRFFGAMPLVANAAKMAEQSPISAAQDMNTPLLLIAGVQDTRAPYAQTVAFYRRLSELGKPVRLLVYPRDGHGPGTPRAQDDYVAHIAGWFAAHGGPHALGALAPEDDDAR